MVALFGVRIVIAVAAELAALRVFDKLNARKHTESCDCPPFVRHSNQSPFHHQGLVRPWRETSHDRRALENSNVDPTAHSYSQSMLESRVYASDISAIATPEIDDHCSQQGRVKLRKLLFRSMLTALGLMTVLAPASVVRAEETTCRGTLGAVTVDNLRVPDGATCTLNGTRVQGTVKVETGATLRANGVRVIGNIQAENHAAVNVGSSSTVGGSVQIKQGGSANVSNTRINGDLQYLSNRRSLVASRNTIGGSLQAFQNRGGLSITNNRIDGNLQCKENNPPPTGGGNVVQGNKEDQCARL